MAAYRLMRHYARYAMTFRDIMMLPWIIISGFRIMIDAYFIITFVRNAGKLPKDVMLIIRL